MQIVLSGALPDPNFARELTSYISSSAPTLLDWFKNSNAQVMLADPAQTLCNALEYWQIKQNGLLPNSNLPASMGLGPLTLLNTSTENIQEGGKYTPIANEKVWLLELVHISPARDGAALIPAKDLNISADHSKQLFNSALEFFNDSGFTLHPFSHTHWRVTLPDTFMPHCASPELVSISTVNEWWKQDSAGRPWRRLSNELQMLWFDHEVNRQRFKQQLMPINAVWLFGGGTNININPNAINSTGKSNLIRSLEQAFISQDWGSWIQILSDLEQTLFKTIESNKQPELVLTGHDRIVTLSPVKGIWNKLRPGRKNAWKKWWLNQT